MKNICLTVICAYYMMSHVTALAENNTQKSLNEFETQNIIQEFVQKRTTIKADNNLDRIPGKFRYTEQFQQQKKKVEAQGEVNKQELQKYHKELDFLATNYRTTAERTPSGLWKLGVFYDAFGTNAPKEAKQYWDSYTANIEDWIHKFPSSPAPRIALAETLIKRAWAYRGTLPARHVQAKDMEAFKYYISQARNYLQQTKKLSSQDPHWYVVMSVVAMAENWELVEFLNLMEEGTSRYPYYYDIYFSGMNYLLPRWNGSFEKMESFANAAVEKTKAKEKMGLYARVYWSAVGVYGHKLFEESAVVWDKMRQGMFDVLDQYPDQWNINNFAYFACMAKDKATTKTLIEKVSVPIGNVWQGKEVFEVCKNWANGKDS